MSIDASRSWIAERLLTRVRADLAQALSLRFDADPRLVPAIEQYLSTPPPTEPLTTPAAP